MGYFSNGTERMRFQDQYCSRCIHGPKADDPDYGCPVMDAHLLYSYGLCNSEAPGKVILDMLIPPDGAGNGQCAMFVERPARRS